MEGKNKFQQELYLRENPEAETPEEMQDMLTNQYRSIIRSRISSPYNYKAKKFVSLCSKINEDLEALAEKTDEALCVSYKVPANSLPPGSIFVLESQLEKMGFDIFIECEETHEGDIFNIRIRCMEEVNRDEENSEDRNTEFSESQEHND